MEFRQFRYFLIAAEELHFTRAARRLNIAQPALSQQIRQMEEELGTLLFHRLTRGVELTDAGHAFLPFARALMVTSEAGISAAKRAAKGELGQLRIGFTGSASFNPIVTRTIGRFREAYSDVELVLQENATTSLLKMLGDNQIQLAFLRSTEDEMRDLRKTRLPDEALWAAVPTSHPLARQGCVALAALSEQRFVLYPRSNGRLLYDTIIAACGQAGFSPLIVQEAPQMTSTINLVAAGVGVTLVPESMQQIQSPKVTYLRLTDPEPRTSLTLVQGQDLLMTAVVRNFIRCLEETKQEQA